MSRIGKIPVEIPAKVSVTVSAEAVSVKGPKGEVKHVLVDGVTVAVDEGGKKVLVNRASDSKEHKALHGLYRAMIRNMIVGVTKGYEKTLRIVGTGYRVELKGKTLVIQAGFCHPVEFTPPSGVEIEVPKSTSREFMDFIVRGADKQAVGETAARLRRVRPPDLYKNKGIRYGNEKVRKLEGKSFTTGG